MLFEKYGRRLWKLLTFSLADNFFTISKIVSISIEANRICLVSGTKIFWKISIKSFHKISIDENKKHHPEYLATVISKALDDWNTSNVSFVLCVPRSWAITQVAEFPITVKENLANVMSYELDRLTPLNPENAYYDYKIID